MITLEPSNIEVAVANTTPVNNLHTFFRALTLVDDTKNDWASTPTQPQPQDSPSTMVEEG